MELGPFLQIEKKYDLVNANVDGYFFWIYLRASLEWCYERLHNNLEGNNKQSQIGFNAKLKQICGKAKNVLTKSRIPSVKDGVLILNHPRRVLVNGVYDCVYTDDLAEQLDNCVVLEEPYQGIHYRPIRTKKIVYTDIIDLLSFLYCSFQRILFRKQYKRNKDMMLSSIYEPIMELNKAYGVDISPYQFGNELIFGLCMYKVEKRYYRRVISKLHPKVIVEVVSYNRKCMVVNEVAADMGIPTVELQHGTIGEEHVSYNFPQGWRIKQFPRYLFLFSEYWKNKASFPINEEAIISVGYPYLEKMTYLFSKHEKNATTKKNVLFLSSGPIGKKLADIAVGLKEILNEEEYNIIFKLHPREYETWKERYPTLLKSDIEVIDNNKISLYELFSISDIQVSGFNSTTVFEGLSFSLQTYILDYCVSKEIASLCSNGIAEYFCSSQELSKLIMRNGDKQLDEKVSFWEKDGMHNMIENLKNIVNTNIVHGDSNEY